MGVFTMPKLKRLMEDESLRAVACSRLNCRSDRKHLSEDEFVEEVVSVGVLFARKILSIFV